MSRFHQDAAGLEFLRDVCGIRQADDCGAGKRANLAEQLEAAFEREIQDDYLAVRAVREERRCGARSCNKTSRASPDSLRTS